MQTMFMVKKGLPCCGLDKTKSSATSDDPLGTRLAFTDPDVRSRLPAILMPRCRPALLCVSLSLPLALYIYLYMCVYVCVCVDVYDSFIVWHVFLLVNILPVAGVS